MRSLMILLLLVSGLTAGEREEVERIAPAYGATATEFRLWDNTRVDMINNVYAFEVDWAHKWPEAIGQALYYAEVTDREPAIILLVKGHAKAWRYHVWRAQTVCAKYDIKLYLERGDLEG